MTNPLNLRFRSIHNQLIYWTGIWWNRPRFLARGKCTMSRYSADGILPVGTKLHFDSVIQKLINTAANLTNQ